MSGSDFTISTLDIITRNALLEQAAYELDALSGNLGPSGAVTTTPDGDGLRSLKKDAARFGDYPNAMYPVMVANLPPRKRLVPVTIDQLSEQYNFYYVSIPITLDAQGNWAFNRLVIEVELSSEDAPPFAQPIAYQIFPEDQSETVAKGTFKAGGTLETNAEASASVTPQHADFGIAQAEFGAGGKAEGYLRIGGEINKNFERKKALITQQGIDQREAILTIEKTEFLREDLQIAIIVQLPKENSLLKMSASMQAYRSFVYAPRRLKEVFDQLSKKVQDLFKGGVPINIGPQLWDLTPKLTKSV